MIFILFTSKHFLFPHFLLNFLINCIVHILFILFLYKSFFINNIINLSLWNNLCLWLRRHWCIRIRRWFRWRWLWFRCCILCYFSCIYIIWAHCSVSSSYKIPGSNCIIVFFEVFIFSIISQCIEYWLIHFLLFLFLLLFIIILFLSSSLSVFIGFI